jgi:hypothetical protein
LIDTISPLPLILADSRPHPTSNGFLFDTANNGIVVKVFSRSTIAYPLQKYAYRFLYNIAFIWLSVGAALMRPAIYRMTVFSIK